MAKTLQHSSSIRLSQSSSGRYVAELRGVPSLRAEAETPDEAECLLLEMLSEARGLGLRPGVEIAPDQDAVPNYDDIV